MFSFPDSSKWITSPVMGGPRTSAPAVYYRRAFNLESIPDDCRLHITALGLFECEINGRRVSEDVFAPGWTEYTKRVPFFSYDVTNLLKKGGNVIGVVLGDGWYSGHVAMSDRQKYGEQPCLLACLVSSDEREILSSGAEWKYAIGPILENDLLMGEAYDARRELGDWSAPGFDDRTWSSVLIAPDPGIAVEPPPGPPVRRHEILPGTELTKQDGTRPGACRRRYDFGQNFIGRLRFKVQGKRGRTLCIRHAEILDADGSLYTENLRSARATDHYTLKGEGVEEWEPRFTFHGFRFAEFTWEGDDTDVTLESVEGVVIHSDMEVTGKFSCSNPLLNQLTHNILWGQKSNFLEIPTDCPQRDERLGWTGDAQVFCRTAAFFMDVRRFFHKWLRDLRDAQSPEGSIPPFAPNTRSFGVPGDGGPAWADAVFICPWTLYLCYGDKSFIEDNYAAMVGYLDYLAENKVKDHIRPHPDLDDWGGFGDWLALDGSGRTDGGTPKELIGTAFHAHATEIAAKCAALLGRDEEAWKYSELNAEIAQAFAANFVTPEGRVVGGSQTGYVIALHFGLVPEKARPMAAAELVRLIRKNGYRIGTGFVGTPYILQVLEANGYLDVAYKLLEQEAFPSWLFPVKNGATTIWERWDGWTPDKGFQDTGMNSFNHYAYGAVGAWMVSTVAGLELDPEEPGYRHILFKPRPGGSLSQASAGLLTPKGKAAISWELVDKGLELELTVPEGTRATLQLAEPFDPEPRELGPGQHKLAYAARG